MFKLTKLVSMFFFSQPPYWNYRDQSSYLTDDRHTARQSVEGASQSNYEASGYTSTGLRSYTTETYSAPGE